MSVNINKSEIESIGKGDTWKYFTSVFNMMDAARYYRLVTRVILEDKTKENKSVLNGEREILPEERLSFPFGDLVKIGDINVSRHFMNSLFIINFFQYSRNAYDYVSHIINEFFIDDSSKIKDVDFHKICYNKSLIKNNNVIVWIDKVINSSEFIYVNDYCNQTKHNYDMGIRQNLDTATWDIYCSIPGFKKGDRDHPEEKGLQKMEEVHRFVASSLSEFMQIIREYLDKSDD